MANHVRRQIREGVATALTGLATTGARVFQSRVYPLQTTELPGLLVRTINETSTPITIESPATLDRTLRIAVVAVAKATADVDDVLDQIAKEVETALAFPVAALGALVKSLALVASEIEIVAAEQPTGQATLTFEAVYFTLDNAPDVAL
jgi:hypothetical protein